MTSRQVRPKAVSKVPVNRGVFGTRNVETFDDFSTLHLDERHSELGGSRADEALYQLIVFGSQAIKVTHDQGNSACAAPHNALADPDSESRAFLHVERLVSAERTEVRV